MTLAELFRIVVFVTLTIGFGMNLPNDLKSQSFWWATYDVSVFLVCGWHLCSKLVDALDQSTAKTAITFMATALACSSAMAQQTSTLSWDDPKLALHVPQEILQKFQNPDGSCVQCANGMTGTDQGVPEFAWLLWESEYGKPVRGGSNPSRVAGYAKARNVRIYNVTGSKTWDWMRSACLSGRGAAIGAGGSHFQTLVGYQPDTKMWQVVNNNGDQRIQDYTDEAFRRLHLASGQWCVILDYPPAPAPGKVRAWWD